MTRRWRDIQRWRPAAHIHIFGIDYAVPAACTCDRRLADLHTEQSCPYIDPDSWYAAEVQRMKERAPA